MWELKRPVQVISDARARDYRSIKWKTTGYLLIASSFCKVTTSERFVFLCRDCRITNVVDFGIFVRIAPGTSGLVHWSQLGIEDEAVEEYFEVGWRVDVEIVAVNPNNRYSLRLVEDKESQMKSEEVLETSGSGGHE